MTIQRGNHTNLSRFPARPIIVGDNQRRTEHFISCSNCPEEITSINIGAVDDEMLVKKFGRAGWYVGRVSGSHLCPDCNPTRQRAVSAVMPKAKSQPQPEEETPVPRDLTFSDKRIINAKLEEIYESDLLGYRNGWNDARVAKDLGVEEQWVAGQRSLNFGPATGNSVITEIRREHDQLAKDLEAFRAQGEKLTKRFVALAGKMESAGLKGVA